MFYKGSFRNLRKAIGPEFQVGAKDPLERCRMSLALVHISFFFAEY
jgi:hypothetical protein